MLSAFVTVCAFDEIVKRVGFGAIYRKFDSPKKGILCIFIDVDHSIFEELKSIEGVESIYREDDGVYEAS